MKNRQIFELLSESDGKLVYCCYVLYVAALREVGCVGAFYLAFFSYLYEVCCKKKNQVRSDIGENNLRAFHRSLHLKFLVKLESVVSLISSTAY
jgi:hypothetical protein